MDQGTGVSLGKLSQLAGTPVTGVMYKKQAKGKMLHIEDGFAKPTENDETFITLKHAKTGHLRCAVRHVRLSTLEISAHFG